MVTTRSFAISLLIAITIILSSGRAQIDDRAALIKEIVEIQGIGDMVRSAKSATVAQAKGAMKQMFDQFRSDMPNLSEDALAKIEAAANKLMYTVESSWSPEEAIQVWEAQYTAEFTEDDLRSIRDVLKTPFGQKQIAAGKRANIALQAYIAGQAKSVIDIAMKDYIAELQNVVRGK